MKQHLLARTTVIPLITAIAAPLFLIGCHAPPKEPTLVPVPVNSFMVAWTAPLELGKKDAVSSLHVRDNTLFVYTQSNRGFWLGAAGGQFLTSNQIADPDLTVYPPVVLADRTVIPTTVTFEVFDASGKNLESLRSPSAIQSPAAAGANSLFVGVTHPGSGRLARFDLDGSLDRVWELSTSAGIVAAPAVYTTSIYGAGIDGRVYGVTAGRDAIWSLEDYSFRTDGPVTADLAVDEFGVYVASQDKKLYCLERSSGKIKWIYFAGMPLVDQPTVIGNVVYQLVPLPGGSRMLVAINKTDGLYHRLPMWVQPAARQILSNDDQYLYVLSGQSTILALDKASGEPQFNSTRDDLRVFATNLSSPMIYAATLDGTVLGIRPILRPGLTGELVQTPFDLPVHFAAAR